jgi:eukaryotic-like serine/threonine-protein kinase
MSTALQEGSVFAGRYRIERCIAMGGMGAVYEATHIETQRRRALKVMLPQMFHGARKEEMKERFRREARIAAQIESEFIVDVFDAGVDEPTGMPFLVMELLRGEELGARLERLGRLAPAEAVTWLYQTALALDKTHKASIVHRDLKPENLFITHREHGEPTIKVLDFGIAKFVAENATSANATQSVGTPMYMAPEQFRNGTVTPAVDIFALGMLAYTFLVGAPYWEGEIAESESLIAFIMVAGYGPKEPATARASRAGVSLPKAFDAWFAHATAIHPPERFACASVAIEALAQALGEATPTGKTMVSVATPLPALAEGSTGTGTGTGSARRLSDTPGSMASSFIEEQTSSGARRRKTGILVGAAIGAVAVTTGVVSLVVALRAPAPPTATGITPLSASMRAAESAAAITPGASALAATTGALTATSATPPAVAPAGAATTTTATSKALPKASAAKGTPPPGTRSPTEPMYTRD